jgi:hypothetical protein
MKKNFIEYDGEIEKNSINHNENKIIIKKK